jgi:hypothetical protein
MSASLPSTNTTKRSLLTRLLVISGSSLLFCFGLVVLIYFHEEEILHTRNIHSNLQKTFLFADRSLLRRATSTSGPEVKTRDVLTTEPSTSKDKQAVTNLIPTMAPTKNFYDYQPPEEFQRYIWDYYADNYCFDRMELKCQFKARIQSGSDSTIACENCCEIYHYCDTHVVGLIDDIDGFCNFDDLLDKAMLITCDCLNDASVYKAWDFFKKKAANCQIY